MPSFAGYSARMKNEERNTVNRTTAVKDRADEVGAMSGRVWRLRVKCFLFFFFLNIPNGVQFFFILTFSTIPKINGKSKSSCGGIDPRNYIWEVRSKASMPEMTRKPLKAFLHRKAAEIRRFFKTALARKGASSIFDMDKRACFNFWFSKLKQNFLLLLGVNCKRT